MILADSNVFIDFWNNPSDEIVSTFESEDVVICGIIRAELLHGAYSEKNLIEMTKMLEAFDELNLDSSDWQILGEQLYKLRTHGIAVPLGDAIIASIAIKYGVPVWTNDKHFKVMQVVLENLQLYRQEQSS